MTTLSSRGNRSRQERLPRNFEQVTADWLSGLLETRYPGIEVHSMTLVELIDGHTTKARINVDLNDAGRKGGLGEDLCLKANWTGSERSSAVCVDEARFYDRMPDCLAVPAPKCYFADWDDDAVGKQGIVVLEDLVTLGGSFTTSAQGISPADAMRSVSSLATLHGSSWGNRELDNLDWLQESLAPDTCDDYWMLLEDVVEQRIKDRSWTGILPDWIAEDPYRLHAAFKQLRSEELADPGPYCLIHGDAHLGNTCLRPNGERIWLDWQLPRRGRPWRDYTYFVICALDVEDRRENERRLLQRYLDELARYGVRLDFERAWIDYRRWVIWGLIAWLTNINPHEPSAPLLDRFSRAAEDLDIRELFAV